MDRERSSSEGFAQALEEAEREREREGEQGEEASETHMVKERR